MDRKHNKKVKRYLCIYIAFSLLFSVLLYMQISYERVTEQRRMAILLASHPEWEAEIAALWNHFDENSMNNIYNEEMSEERIHDAVTLIREKYGHDLRCIVPEKTFLLFWAAGMLAGAALTALLGYRERRGRWKSDDFDEIYQELRECLEQFQRGNFRQIPDYDDASEEEMRLWETVRELGIYFEGLKEQLRAEEDSTKALITDISHQLKTPLASLRMSYELVNSDHISEEEKREFQEQEAKEIEKLETLLAELVNLSRLEKHMIQIKPVPASLKATITEAVNRIYMKARNKNMEIQVEMDKDIEIRHDPKWTVEAFVNVLDNAVKYSDEYTTVTVRVQPLVKNVLIQVEDQGMGLRPEEFVKIYQRFYRGSEAREKVKEGAGVGLYLSRLILERQSGTIFAERRAERGTVFKMTLPS